MKKVRLFLATLLVMGCISGIAAAEAQDESAEKAAAVQRFIEHHIADSSEWHPLPFLPGIHLPEFMTLHALMLVICAITMVLLFVVLYKKDARSPSGLTNALEALVIYIRDEISIQFLGEEDGKRMAPLFCSFFFFILILNLMGLIPIFATATANFSVTFALALITFFFMVFGAMFKNGIGGFFKAFAPQGVPWPVLILIIPIEFIGIFIKAFALMVRLFANMLAGHIIIFALLGLLVTFGFFALPSVALALGIYLLEILVAFLQAYIFTVLSAIFIGQMYHPAH